MKFESTKKLFFKAGPDFEERLKEMQSSENCIHFSLKMGQYPCFFYYGIPMFELFLSLQAANAGAVKALHDLPEIAKNQFLRNALVEEIKLTNEIEGVFSSKREIFELLTELGKRKKKKIGSIVSKCNLLFEGKEKKVTTCEEIRAIYDEMFFSGGEPLIDPDDRPDGKLFRKGYVGVYSDSSNEPIYKGLCPEEEIIKALEEGLKILGDEKDLNAFLRIALFHAFFEYAHPFYDGNGRVGRFIASLSLLQDCQNPIAGFLLSKEINKNKSKYYKLFEETEDPRNRGDLSVFVYGFLELVLDLLNGCKEYATSKKDEFDALLEKHKGELPELSKNESAVLSALCEAALFSDFGIEAKEIAESRGISEKTVSRVLDSFSRKGIIEKEKFGRKSFFKAKRL